MLQHICRILLLERANHLRALRHIVNALQHLQQQRAKARARCTATKTQAGRRQARQRQRTGPWGVSGLAWSVGPSQLRQIC